jgi:hypothetical protein
MNRAESIGLLGALLLAGCASSPPAVKNYIPPIPQGALDPCLPPPFSLMMLHDRDVDAVVKLFGAAVAQCEAKRRLLVEQWPKGKPK